jgi:hypothetical protein
MIAAIAGVFTAFAAGCDMNQEVSGTWMGIATPVSLQDGQGGHATALVLTPWSGPPLPPRMIRRLEGEAKFFGNLPEPVRYVLIRVDHAIIDPDASIAGRAIEVRGTISESGYRVFSSDQRNLGMKVVPTGSTRSYAIVVRDLRPIGFKATRQETETR